MQMRTAAFVVLVLTGALGAASLAAIPESNFNQSAQPAPKALSGGERLTLAAQYGPVASYLDVIPLGQGEIGLPGVTAPTPAPRTNSNSELYASHPDPVPRQDSAPQTPVVILAAGAGAENVDCKLDQYGRRSPIPLERLISLMKTGVEGLGQGAPLDAVRAIVQSDLNRSGDVPQVKTQAVDAMRGQYAVTTIIGQALSKPFDLYDDAPTNVPGYDPCGSPAAIGGGAFGVGPFASDFATINPVPVIASRLAAATEGGK